MPAQGPSDWQPERYEEHLAQEQRRTLKSRDRGQPQPPISRDFLGYLTSIPLAVRCYSTKFPKSGVALSLARLRPTPGSPPFYAA